MSANEMSKADETEETIENTTENTDGSPEAHETLKPRIIDYGEDPARRNRAAKEPEDRSEDRSD